MNKNRGFIGIVVLIVLGLVILGGGYYVATKMQGTPGGLPVGQLPTLQTDTNTSSNSQAQALQATTNVGTHEADMSAPSGYSVPNPNSDSAQLVPSITITNVSGLTVSVQYSNMLYTPTGASTPASLWVQNIGFSKPALKVPLTGSSAGTATFTLPANAMEGAYSIAAIAANGSMFVTANPRPSVSPDSATFNFSGGVISSGSVPGMRKYTDLDFGFSFWYPGNWSVTGIPVTVPSVYGGTILKKLQIKGASYTFVIEEFYSPKATLAYPGGPCGYCTAVTIYFDASQHTWMHQYPQGVGGAPDMSQAQFEQTKIPTPADVSNNTMGGLHIFPTEQKENAAIVPLSAHNFLVIREDSYQNPGTRIELPLVMTVLVADSSVATPVSAAEQTATIQAEATAYAGQ